MAMVVEASERTDESSCLCYSRLGLLAFSASKAPSSSSAMVMATVCSSREREKTERERELFLSVWREGCKRKKKKLFFFYFNKIHFFFPYWAEISLENK